MKSLMVFYFLLTVTSAFPQNFFKNSKTLITWNAGDNISQSTLLRNGCLLQVYFDGMVVNVKIVSDTKNYFVEYFEETAEWEKMQITEHDFDNDGKNELVIGYGNRDASYFYLLVYKITKSGAREIGSFDGQSYCWFEKNKIKFPDGVKAIYNEHTLKKGRFVATRWNAFHL